MKRVVESVAVAQVLPMERLGRCSCPAQITDVGVAIAQGEGPPIVSAQVPFGAVHRQEMVHDDIARLRFDLHGAERGGIAVYVRQIPARRCPEMPRGS